MKAITGRPARGSSQCLPGKRAATAITVAVLNLALPWSVTGLAAGYDSSPAVSTTSAFAWPPGKRAALSLTFDDARPSQMAVGLPILERHRARATFYVTPDNLDAQLARWKLAVSQGQEIGNHSLTHPCTGNFAFARTNALEDYMLAQLEEDLRLASLAIRSRLEVEPVSFAYPCGQTFIGRGAGTRSYVPLIAQRFESGRLWRCEDANDPFRCDPAQLLAMELDGKAFTEVRPLLDHALKQGTWLILAGHEIGGMARQTTLTNTLEAVCAFAADPANGLWLDTVGTVARHVRERRSSSTAPPP